MNLGETIGADPLLSFSQKFFTTSTLGRQQELEKGLEEATHPGNPELLG
jgi:hypothetical protein